jgi:hypothetical protein
MIDEILDFERRSRRKILWTVGGATVGTGALLLSQSCPGGQCAACGGACASRLPLLAIPLVLQGAALVVGKLRQDADSAGKPDA